MQRTPARILVVDDFGPWLAFVEDCLGQDTTLRIIGLAVDGVEAVAKARELRPDLILLDLGLPKLSGIDAAVQIRRLAPASMILFLTECSDPDVVQAALGAGGSGYILKSAATRDLLVAVKAVLRGDCFVSPDLYPYGDPT